MLEKYVSFVNRHDLFIITTHDPADADGIGAQLVLRFILHKQGKQCRIINASPVPRHFKFMDPQGFVEHWDEHHHGSLPEQAAVFMLDTASMHNIGIMRDPVCRAKEVFIIDHHELHSENYFIGICDPKSASTCEMTVELAAELDILLDLPSAFAAYTGIVYDTGFFSYQKTCLRTFVAAAALVKLGLNPNDAYYQLCENNSTESLLLQQKALASLKMHCNGRAASQVLLLADFTETGARSDDTEGLVNIPLKAKDIVVSFLIKEVEHGKLRCSLRSKGTVDISKIAHNFGGGGHINAAGFKTDLGIDELLELVMAKVSGLMDKA